MIGHHWKVEFPLEGSAYRPFVRVASWAKTLWRMSEYFWSILVSFGSSMSSSVSDFRLLMAGCGPRCGMLLFLGFK